jgi:hypothetical protein
MFSHTECCASYDRNILSEDFMPEFYEWFYFTVQLSSPPPPPHVPSLLTLLMHKNEKKTSRCQSGKWDILHIVKGEQHFCCNIFSLKVHLMRFF